MSGVVETFPRRVDEGEGEEGIAVNPHDGLRVEAQERAFDGSRVQGDVSDDVGSVAELPPREGVGAGFTEGWGHVDLDEARAVAGEGQAAELEPPRGDGIPAAPAAAVFPHGEGGEGVGGLEGHPDEQGGILDLPAHVTDPRVFPIAYPRQDAAGAGDDERIAVHGEGQGERRRFRDGVIAAYGHIRLVEHTVEADLEVHALIPVSRREVEGFEIDGVIVRVR